MMPSKSVVSTFRNTNMVVPHFSAMSAPYSNVFHAAINPSIQMYPPMESQHRQDMQSRANIGSADRGDPIEMTTFPVSYLNLCFNLSLDF